MRKALVAGQFYEGDFQKLNGQIKKVFEKGPGALPISKREKNIIGAVIPHAGYEFSGKCAAWGYKEVAESKFPDCFVLLGVNHSGISDKAFLSLENWDTPFGTVKTDKSASKLVNDVIEVNEEAHSREHSIEVQLPFLQFISEGYSDRLKIVPIILGTHDYGVCKKVADSIVNWKKDIVVVASSDFTHYGVSYGYMPYRFNIKEEVKNLDKKAIMLICQLRSREFLEYVDKTGATICGAAPIAVLIEILKKLKSKEGKLLSYYNSGDISKDYSNFVGYGSIVFER